MCTHVCTLCARSEIQTDQQTLITPIQSDLSQNKNGGRRWESNPPDKTSQHVSSVLKTETGTSHATPAILFPKSELNRYYKSIPVTSLPFEFMGRQTWATEGNEALLEEARVKFRRR